MSTEGSDPQWSPAGLDVPLAVDLDGTLIKTDLLVESAVRLIRDSPVNLILLVWWLRGGKAFLKAQVASRVLLDPALLPYNNALLAHLKDRRSEGVRLVLATASHQRLASSVAQHVGLFDDVMATDASINLAGKAKRDSLIARFGSRGFDYAGNGRADLVIWEQARHAVLVNPNFGVERAARAGNNVAAVLTDRQPSWRVLARALRVHQWLKNLLVFVPLIAAHAWNSSQALVAASLAFASLSLTASAIYLINDAVDLDADRAHRRKRRRPLAAGDLSLIAGASLSAALLVAGIATATFVSQAFSLIVVLYVATTSAYSFYFKTFMLVDVLLLASLYTLRVVAGAVAIAVTPSFWLLAFSMFAFVSLALAKRCAELEALRELGESDAKRRDYHVQDLPLLTSLGTAAGYGAVIILALYINSNDVLKHYRDPRPLWLLCPLLMYWTGRIWVKVGRGEMHDDPIVYAVRDRTSWLVALAAAVFGLIAL